MAASLPRCSGVLMAAALGRSGGGNRFPSMFLPPLSSSISRGGHILRSNVGFDSPTYQARAYCAAPGPEVCLSEVPSPPSDESDPVVMEAARSLDIRAGRILRAWRHPEADSLYVEEVDVGEAEPRTICSGLVKYIPLDHLQDAMVVVLANLKPRNMRGVKSNGMLMAASDASHETVELLFPPEGSLPGEKIWFGTELDKDKQPVPASPNQIQKKKIWESVQPHLKTTHSCIAVLGQHPLRTSSGTVACRSLKNANIS